MHAYYDGLWGQVRQNHNQGLGLFLFRFRIWARFLFRRRCFQLISFLMVDLFRVRVEAGVTFRIVFFCLILSYYILEQLAFGFWLDFSLLSRAEFMKVLRSIVQLFTFGSAAFCSLLLAAHRPSSSDLLRNSLIQALVLPVVFISRDLLGIELSFKVFIFSDSRAILSFFACKLSIVFWLSAIFFLNIVLLSSSSSMHLFISSIFLLISSFWVTNTMVNSMFFLAYEAETSSIRCLGGSFCQNSSNSQRSSSVSVRSGKYLSS